MTDTHCHLNFPQFDADRSKVIERCAGELDFLVNVGSGLRASRAAVELASAHDKIYASVGIHPHDTENLSSLRKKKQEKKQNSNKQKAGGAANSPTVRMPATCASIDEQVEFLAGLLRQSPKIVAIGEAGLDYSPAPPGEKDRGREVQKELFAAQIELARRAQLPLIVHSRDAFADTLDMLREGRAERVVLHCFTYGVKEAKEVLASGYFISFTGILTFKNAKALQIVAQAVPLERVMLETDAPFLAPEPHRGQRAEPWMVRHIAAKLAELKNISIEEVERVTDQTARGFFKLAAI